MSTYSTQHGFSDAQVEIEERPYHGRTEHPLVEVTVWGSIEDSRTLLFEETDPARRGLEPAGQVLGRLPRAVVTALENRGYTVSH